MRARRGMEAQQRGPANVPVPPASPVEQVIERGSALRDVLCCGAVGQPAGYLQITLASCSPNVLA